MSEQGDDYLVWSHEHNGWWRAGGAGYTRNPHEAGRYSRDKALRICANAAFGSDYMRGGVAHGGSFNELPVRVEDVRFFMQRAGLGGL